MTDESDLTGATPRRHPKPSVLEIGGRRLKPATLMMGHGFVPPCRMLAQAADLPDSTFVFANAAAGSATSRGSPASAGGPRARLCASTAQSEILEPARALGDAEDALTFSSGMPRSTLLLAFVQPGDVVVHSGPLYAATETLIGRILGRFGVKWLDFPAGATEDEIADVVEQAKALGRVPLIYLESPANPTNALVDVQAVRRVADAAFPADGRPPIAIDNTFLGPLWLHPLRHGADLSVYSLTKYAGGHSDLVAGGITGSKELINVIRMLRNTIGTITDPNTAWMLLRSLETLELRMTRAGENADKVCRFLRDHPKVESVGYLGFLEGGDDARQADIYRRHCTGAGSTFSLY